MAQDLGRRSVGRGARGAFTLIELLVVIGIIGVLIGLTFAVGRGVLNSGKQRVTAETIKVLDLAMKEYIASREQVFPALASMPGATAFVVPMVDGVEAENRWNTAKGEWDYSLVPTTTWFIKTIQEYDRVEAADAAINGINPKLMRIEVPAPGEQAGLGQMQGKRVVPLDGWGNPIRMVHPKFDGIIGGNRNVGSGDQGSLIATADAGGNPPPLRRYLPNNIRRNWLSKADRQFNRERDGQGGVRWAQMRGDSDGGVCVGGMPYFYSGGADGDPSTADDNVYAITPQLPKDQ
ncbi:MAG: type II secretion system protein [Phycisphaeraceae bacterium]|nr:MAG: type II secretion system protein [Phycisphaeraceae bacterium]